MIQMLFSSLIVVRKCGVGFLCDVIGSCWILTLTLPREEEGKSSFLSSIMILAGKIPRMRTPLHINETSTLLVVKWISAGEESMIALCTYRQNRSQTNCQLQYYHDRPCRMLLPSMDTPRRGCGIVEDLGTRCLYLVFRISTLFRFISH